MELVMSRPPSIPAASAVRLRSIHEAVHLMDARAGVAADPVARRRRLLADLCRILGDRLTAQQNDARAADTATAWERPAGAGNQGTPVSLSPRMRQTLERLLAGDSEKEIAARLRLSPHTVHVYVKTLYRRFDVCSRGELFARFISRRNDVAE